MGAKSINYQLSLKNNTSKNSMSQKVFPSTSKVSSANNAKIDLMISPNKIAAQSKNQHKIQLNNENSMEAYYSTNNKKMEISNDSSNFQPNDGKRPFTANETYDNPQLRQSSKSGEKNVNKSYKK
jgi:hypothetical protein